MSDNSSVIGEYLQVSPEKLFELAENCIGDRPFVVISNREPYEHSYAGGKIVARRTVGGLTSALEPMMQAIKGVWIAWGSGKADKDVVDENDAISLPPSDPKYRLRRVWLSDDDVEKYYTGHANQTLWPLCHLQTDKVRFFRSEWDAYQSVNRRFAEAAATELKQNGGIAWFHDYHFATAPAMLRDLLPDTFIMHFWHIPWPSWEIFRQHPQRRAILEGILGCDLICMQTDTHCQNFLDCVKREFAYPVDMIRQIILLENRSVRVSTQPISIDAASIHKQSLTRKTQKLGEKFRHHYLPRNEKLGIGVERADYSKGIILRLRALDLLFQQYPEWRGRFTFLQVSPVSRKDIPAYMLYQQAIDRLIKDINHKYGFPEWQPIIHIRTAKTFEELIALYCIADTAIVSSRQDGMNLVGKEFIAARSDGQGVLILSEFAGASEEMHQSVTINPYDVEGFAHAIHTALLMPVEEQQRRMQQLRNHIFQHTVYDWLADILTLIPARHEASNAPISLLDSLTLLRKRIEEQGKVELFCDYDGVLSPIAARPEEARLSTHIRDLLIKLRDSANMHVSIISGRSLDNLMEVIAIERLTYAGNHGLEISGPHVSRLHPESEQVHAALRLLYQELREAMQLFTGVIVEDKQLGLALHFRLAEKSQIPVIVDRFYNLVHRFDPEHLLRIVPGKCVLEARPNVLWDKGKATVWLLNALHGSEKNRRLAIYLGDDTTDEDAFKEIRRKKGITVFVGDPTDRKTAAEYYLPDTAAVAVFLEWMTTIIQ